MTTKTKKKTFPNRAAPRHKFLFKVMAASGKPKLLKPVWAKVKKARRSVTLVLTADDVRRSMGLHGVGNTQTCSMAVCAYRNRAAFDHPVEGYIDWQYSRAYVVSKVSRKTGFPSECVVYKHNDDIARMNDTPGGQRQLLMLLVEMGDRSIVLHPVTSRKGEDPTHRPMGKSTGKRSPRPAAVGAKLRFAMAMGGAAPQETA
jgi:hypothetical protein